MSRICKILNLLCELLRLVKSLNVFLSGHVLKGYSNKIITVLSLRLTPILTSL
jgi:hypothetical protein